MDRRVFLKRGIFGGALLGLVGGGALFLRKGAYAHRPPRPLQVLDQTAYCVLVAAVQRVVPADEHLALALACDVDTALTYGNPNAGKDLVQVLHLLENGLLGIFFRFSPRLFTEMDGNAQDQALFAWRDARLTLLRGAYHGVRRLVLGAFYTNLGRARDAGYPGPLFEKPAAPAIVETGPLSPPYVQRPLPPEAAPPTSTGTAGGAP